MRRWYPVVVALLAAAASLAVWPRLPARMPVHWNVVGDVDRYGSRLEGALLLPAIIAVLALLVPVLPRIDPRRANYERFRPTYHLVMNVILTFMLGIHLVMLAAALGARPPVHRLAPFGVGALLVILGNVLPRTRSNWMFGIRTPWTLSSDRVWQRTHRVGGYLLFGAGLAIVLAALAAPPFVIAGVTVGAIVVAALGSVAYSYVVWRQEQRP